MGSLKSKNKSAILWGMFVIPENPMLSLTSLKSIATWTTWLPLSIARTTMCVSREDSLPCLRCWNWEIKLARRTLCISNLNSNLGFSRDWKICKHINQLKSTTGLFRSSKASLQQWKHLFDYLSILSINMEIWIVKSHHKTFLDPRHLLEIIPAAPSNPSTNYIFVDEVGQKCSDRSAVHNGQPSQKQHYQCMNLLKLISVWKYLVY